MGSYPSAHEDPWQVTEEQAPVRDKGFFSVRFQIMNAVGKNGIGTRPDHCLLEVTRTCHAKIETKQVASYLKKLDSFI